MTFTSCLLLVAGIVAIILLALLVRTLCRDNYSRRMLRRIERYAPRTYNEARGRGCAWCR